MTEYVRLHLIVDTVTLPIDKLGFTWPPPPYIRLVSGGFEGYEEIPEFPEGEMRHVMARVSMSQLTDEDAEAMEFVARGAEYMYLNHVKQAKESTDE